MQASLHPCKHACVRTHTLANKQGAKEPIDSYLRLTSNLNDLEDAQSGLSSHGCQIQPGTQADTHILTPADTSFRWCVLPSSVLLILRTEHEQPHQERAALRNAHSFGAESWKRSAQARSTCSAAACWNAQNHLGKRSRWAGSPGRPSGAGILRSQVLLQSLQRLGTASSCC